MRAVVGWDIDDVIYPWFDKAHEACVLAGLGKAEKVKPTSWYPYEEYGCTDQEWFDVLALVTENGWLYGHDLEPGALDIMIELDRLGVEQHIVTARGFMAHGEKIREQTHAMLERFLVPHASVTFTRDKGKAALELGLTHAIDDNVGNYMAISEVGVDTYLRDRPWNQSHIVPASRRITDLAQFARVIKRGSVK